MIHDLKEWPEYFQAVKNGTKTFELRKNDRNFQVGDILSLKEWDDFRKEYTGKIIYKKASYILHGGSFGLEKGYCIIGLEGIK